MDLIQTQQLITASGAACGPSPGVRRGGGPTLRGSRCGRGSRRGDRTSRRDRRG